MSEFQVYGIDRVLVATREIDTSVSTFEELLGLQFGDTVDPPDEPIANRVSRTGIEFVSGDEHTAVARFLDNVGPGLYALSLEVSDANAAAETLSAHGIEPIDEMQFGGVRELFYHPEAFEGVLLALTEYDRAHPAELAAAENGWTQERH